MRSRVEIHAGTAAGKHVAAPSTVEQKPFVKIAPALICATLNPVTQLARTA
jgi:hypothetical protein